MAWEAVIGLEVHAQLATRSKIFSGSATTFGAEPNTQASLIDLGMPGVLPVLNKEAVHMAVKFGLAIDAEITPYSVFARKNYFYPDLPKGYQISQFELPIVGKGNVEIHLDDGSKKIIGVTRAHLEEDAGKSLHEDFHGMTGIDLNRAGTPLLEIVSEPDIRSAEEAVAYLKSIHSIIRYLNISDGNMAEGSMRCDVNISMRPKGQEEFGTRAEIKNVNSFKFVEKAIHAEMERQIDILESGGEVVQETRLYDANKNETRSMRSKEEANDYRYFPDPDLLPVEVTQEYIDTVKTELPELPAAKAHRYCDEFGLSDYDANVLVASRDIAEYFEQAVNAAGGETKLTANWVMGNLMGSLNKSEITLSECKIKAVQLGELVKLIKDKTITSQIAKTVFEKMWQTGDAPSDIVEREGLKPESDSGAIEAMVDQVIEANPKQVEQYLAAPPEKRKKMLGFFVGQIMKASKGKANPAVVNEILAQKLR